MFIVYLWQSNKWNKMHDREPSFASSIHLKSKRAFRELTGFFKNYLFACVALCLRWATQKYIKGKFSKDHKMNCIHHLLSTDNDKVKQ